MTNGAVIAAAAAHAAIANAIKASGVVVRLTPDDFAAMLTRASNSLVVHAVAGVFTTKYRYLLSYKGFAFYTQSYAPLELPAGIELVQAQKIWIPD